MQALSTDPRAPNKRPATLLKRSHASLVREVLVACNRLPGVDLYAVDVGGARLHELHERLANLPHTSTHPVYVPHLTLAYVKSGKGA